MKTIVKLVITFAIIHAAFRAGDAAWNFYQLKDAAQQTVVFGGSATDNELQAQILKRAEELEVPLVAENIVISREGALTEAAVAYRQEIELLPRYKYPHDFKFKVNGVAVKPTTASDVLPTP